MCGGGRQLLYPHIRPYSDINIAYYNIIAINKVSVTYFRKIIIMRLHKIMFYLNFAPAFIPHNLNLMEAKVYCV